MKSQKKGGKDGEEREEEVQGEECGWRADAEQVLYGGMLLLHGFIALIAGGDTAPCF